MSHLDFRIAGFVAKVDGRRLLIIAAQELAIDTRAGGRRSGVHHLHGLWTCDTWHQILKLTSHFLKVCLGLARKSCLLRQK